MKTKHSKASYIVTDSGKKISLGTSGKIAVDGCLSLKFNGETFIEPIVGIILNPGDTYDVNWGFRYASGDLVGE